MVTSVYVVILLACTPSTLATSPCHHGADSLLPQSVQKVNYLVIYYH